MKIYRSDAGIRGGSCVALFCIALAWLSGDGLAQTGLGKEPGSNLLRLCQAAATVPEGPVAADGQSDARACLAFVDGFVWGHAWASWREAKDMWFCLPQGFTAEQGARDVIKYLSAHPDRLDEDSHLLVFLALTAAYPCKP
jgi:Ssp1 endopeptidase immunity protein Rap1a